MVSIEGMEKVASLLLFDTEGVMRQTVVKAVGACVASRRDLAVLDVKIRLTHFDINGQPWVSEELDVAKAVVCMGEKLRLPEYAGLVMSVGVKMETWAHDSDGEKVDVEQKELLLMFAMGRTDDGLSPLWRPMI